MAARHVSPSTQMAVALLSALAVVAVAAGGVAGATVVAGDAGAVGTGDAGSIVAGDAGAVGTGDAGSIVAGDTGTVGTGHAGVTAAGTGPLAQTDTGGLAENGTVVRLQFEPDGDALWTIRTGFRVNGSADRAAFESLARDFESGEITDLGLQAFQVAETRVDRRTRRGMRITNVRRSSNVTAGTLSIQFRWTNFARAEGDHFVASDVFRTENGTWFGGLRADQTLVVEVPGGYGFLSAPKGPVDGTLRWTGPRTFEPGYMSIEYSQEASPLVPSWAVPVLGGLLALIVGGYALHRRSPGLSVPEMPVPGRSTAETDDASASSGADDAPPAPQSSSDAASTADPEPELLSDEERVERLLEQNGGRMKQASIVEETGWSNAKVSQLLSSMAEEDRIDKLRIGRENLISFPDEDVTDIDE